MINPDAHHASREAILGFIDGQTPVTEAVDALLTNIRTEDGTNVDGDKAWTSCLELLGIACQPHSTGDQALQNLVTFVSTLKQRPEVQEPSVGKNDTNMTFWDTFTMTIREMWNDEDKLTTQQWRNLHAFLAMLWASDTINGSLWPIWCLRSELEEPQTAKGDEPKVFATQAYIQYAGRLMYRSREVWDYNTPGQPKSGNRARPGSIIKSQNLDVPCGYSAERWAFWKRRLTKITDQDGVGEGTHEIARKALSEMDAIEMAEA